MATLHRKVGGHDVQLARFVKAQKGPHGSYDTALAELRRGQKQSCWVWYVLPQLRDRMSMRNEEFQLYNRDEAVAYLRHSVLGSRLLAVVDVVLAHLSKGAAATRLMGTSVDAKKAHQSFSTFFLAALEADEGRPEGPPAVERPTAGAEAASAAASPAPPNGDTAVTKLAEVLQQLAARKTAEKHWGDDPAATTKAPAIAELPSEAVAPRLRAFAASAGAAGPDAWVDPAMLVKWHALPRALPPKPATPPPAQASATPAPDPASATKDEQVIATP